MTPDSFCPCEPHDRRCAAEFRLPAHRGLVRSLATVCVGVFAASLATAILPGETGEANAQRMLTLVSPKRTASVSVAVGKSEDVGTDSSFMDILVGDPEIADVNPLTDKAISILGKKIGTTRVSLYGEGKKQVGIFDIEVSYDVSKLREELAQRFQSWRSVFVKPRSGCRPPTAAFSCRARLRTVSFSTASCRWRANSGPMSSTPSRSPSRSR